MAVFAMPPRTLIVVQNPETKAALEELVRDLPWAPSRGLVFISLSGDVRQGIAEEREREGASPLGFVAEDEPSAISALAEGADEATVLSGIDAARMASFVDRVELRARLRGESQKLHQAFAQAEKLTALGTLVAGVGHEINNPLSAIMLSVDAGRRQLLPALQILSEVARIANAGEPLPWKLIDEIAGLFHPGRPAVDAARLFEDMGSAADSIASIVRDLRIFARSAEEEQPERVPVEDILDHAIRLVGREIFLHGLLERDFAVDVPTLLVPPNRVTQVFTNVLINAAHAIREVPRPDHRVRVSVRADEDFVAVAITDTGPGIPPESLDRIFDPFFTTKRKESGTGLGLAISRAILRRLGGELSVESVYGEGATFVCFLPIPERVPGLPIGRRSEAPLIANSPMAGSVLVVDDDDRVLRSYLRVLNPAHRVVIARDGHDAVDLLESGSAPDVVVLEIDLPGGGGRALLAWLEMNRPELARRTLIVTSAASSESYGDMLRDREGVVLHKPVHGDELLARIQRIMEAPSSG